MDKKDTLKLDNQVCFSLYAASREVIKRYKPILSKYNLTYTQYITMLVIWEYKNISVKDIGKKLHLDSGTLTPLLKKLEGMELIKKYRDIEDDRIVIVEFTEKGMELKEKVSDVPMKLFCSVGLPKEKLLKLKENLDELIKILD